MPHTRSDTDLARLLADRLVDVPDFPKPGIRFKDLTPVFADGPAFAAVVDAVAAHYAPSSYEVVAGIEARGFLVAAALAYSVGAGVVPIRKAGKLPRAVHAVSYALEYGEATLELHRDAVEPGQRVLIVDDVLATGGTAAAALELVRAAGGSVAGLTVLLELSALGGRERLRGEPLHTLMTV